MKNKYPLLITLAILSIIGGLLVSTNNKILTSLTPSLFTSQAGFNDIVINARGTNGKEKIALFVNNAPVQFWNLSNNFQDYTYTPNGEITVSELSIHFLNDTWEPENNINYDVQIPYITVNGTKYNSEHSSTVSTGSWDQDSWCAPGNKQTQWLNCTGSFTYNIPVGTVVGLPIQESNPTFTQSPETKNITYDEAIISFETAGFTGYRLYLDTNNDPTGLNKEEISFTSNVHTHTLTGLTPSTTYFYKVAAFNKAGNEVVSEVISFTTKQENTEPPTLTTPHITNLTQEQTIPTTQEIQFTSSDSTVSEWIIRIGSTPGERDYYESERLTGDTTSITASGLPADTTIYLGLNHKDSTGNWSRIDYIFKTEPLDPNAFRIISSSATPSDTGAVINFTLNEVAQAYTEYGTTQSFGRETFREESFTYSSHEQIIPNPLSSDSELLPGTRYYYRIHATSGDGETIISPIQEFTTTGTSGGSGGNPITGNWDNTVSPPALSSPEVYTLSDRAGAVSLGDINDLDCEGLYYKIQVTSGKDAKVVMDPSSGPLKYPVWISGGRNVHVVGLDLDLEIQDGCDIGEATNFNLRDKNYNPRLPGSIAVRTEQTHTTFIEGVNVELNGMESDCFVLRTPGANDNLIKKVGDVYPDSVRPIITAVRNEQPNRKFYVVNSRCTGFDGYDSDEHETGIAEGIHGDVYQNQGRDAPSVLVFENFTAMGTSNGITSHAWLGMKLDEFKLRNYSDSHDPRFINDSSPKTLGLTFSAHPKESNDFFFENVYINHSRGNNYGIFWPYSTQAKKYGWKGTAPGGGIIQHPGINAGLPPTDMAPESATGINYISPF